MKKQLRSSFSTQGRRMAGARALWAANGMKNILTKSLGSNTAVNMVNATMEGLKSLKTVEEVARLRGKEPGEILG